ncbi:hypothetical protein HYFRA_00005424 [Hymenoscyphus fraxineus]|uniref:DAGKc domain-containing protein n=1 Tax=Hymenoscyphus fraxineus TaxID=746836 RepID=A0A9N9KQI2_9HELO|nr:hypothetical protein HYFRA_00005424 [Hymenoscyphus fraxineus]
MATHQPPTSSPTTAQDEIANPINPNPNDGFTYNNGTLKGNEIEIKDEDIITVTSIQPSKHRYTILSLPPPSDTSPETKAPAFSIQTTHAKSLPDEFLKRHQFQGLPSYLGPDSYLPILISTVSGTGLAPSFFEEVLRPVLDAIGLSEPQYEVIRTESTESILQYAKGKLLRGANEGRSQTVILLSGDGGVVDIINGLLQDGDRSSTYVPPSLIQIPLGTGNALFHTLHKQSPRPSLYIQALRTLLTGTSKPLPTFSASFSPGSRLLTNEGQTATPIPNNKIHGAVVASYGLHSTLVADSDTVEYRKHGAKRFGLVAKDLLFPDSGAPHKYLASVTLVRNGKEEVLERKEHTYILATLVSNLEKTFTISPASRPLDGVLRIVHFGAKSGEQTMNIMKGAYEDGKHIESADVAYEAIDGFKISFQETGESWKWRRCCVDGLIVGVEEGGWMEVKMGKGEEVVRIVSDL